MEGMLRYNDFRPPIGACCITTAPVVAKAPGFNGNAESIANRNSVWYQAAAEILQGGATLSAQAQVSLIGSDRRLQLVGDDSAQAGQFSSAPFAVKRTTNYVLTLPVAMIRGDVAIQIYSKDLRDTLGLVILSAEKRKKNKKREVETDEADAKRIETAKPVEIHFASSDNDEVKIVISNQGAENVYPVVEIGNVGLFELGATPYQWTRLPRSIIRGIQKNIYKTDVFRLLILSGIILLAVGKQKHTLILLLAVPLYYLCAQSVFHTEYRYILAIHYFMFILAAITIYVTSVATFQVLKRVKIGS
jgi:hypothetical protein